LAYPNITFHLSTVEIQSEYREIATTMIKLSHLDNIIDLIPSNVNLDGTIEDIDLLLTENEIRHINFLFIDHEKEKYLSDLIKLEKAKMIKRGTCVVADNVLFAQIDDYLEHMKSLHSRMIIRTESREINVEYTHEILCDSLGKE
jgi:predicted O-methyltransferase YrrM